MSKWRWRRLVIFLRGLDEVGRREVKDSFGLKIENFERVLLVEDELVERES